MTRWPPSPPDGACEDSSLFRGEALSDPARAHVGRQRFARANEAHARVRKWTARVDLFDKDFIIVPVNQSLHWTLAIVCHPGEAARLAARAASAAAAGGASGAAGAHDVIEVRARAYAHVPLRLRADDCCVLTPLCAAAFSHTTATQIDDDDPATDEDAGGPSPVIIQLNSMRGARCCARPCFMHALPCVNADTWRPAAFRHARQRGAHRA
jgi:hypothetical protein